MNHARLLCASLLIATLAGCAHPLTAARATTAFATRPVAHAAPTGYYAAAEGKTGQQLLAALKGVVGPHKDLGYDLARDVMFKDVDDLDNDNQVMDIYLGKVWANVSDRVTAYQNGAGMNAEHTWPQSKGAEGVAKADLHHLFPADVKANSTRSSWPFGEVKTQVWAGGGSELGQNADGVEVFCPRAPQRGDTARAIFYFYLMYSGVGSTNLENFKVEQPVLRRWSKEDPVDANEALRNDKIQAAQGNRNPFVDHPEWIDTVGEFLPSKLRR
ncbi:MAG: endonuclease [Cyanobacteria bacterium RYN_339]|nr:endonuclease [Cyanobacteria bacterium RYN_339]